MVWREVGISAPLSAFRGDDGDFEQGWIAGCAFQGNPDEGLMVLHDCMIAETTKQ